MQRKQKMSGVDTMGTIRHRMMKTFVAAVQRITEMFVAGGAVALVFPASAVDVHTVGIAFVAGFAFILCVLLAFVKEFL